MRQPGLFNEATDARDEGIARVTANNERWFDAALAMTRTVLKDGEETTTELMKQRMLALGLPRPKSENAWGAVTRTLSQRKIFISTGRSMLGTTKASHARRVLIWQYKAPWHPLNERKAPF